MTWFAVLDSSWGGGWTFSFLSSFSFRVLSKHFCNSGIGILFSIRFSVRNLLYKVFNSSAGRGSLLMCVSVCTIILVRVHL